MKILKAMTVVSLIAGPVLADGPGFTDDVIITNLSPDIEFVDTGANESDWEICVGGACGAGLLGVTEAFNVFWKDGTPEGLPFVVEHETSSFLLYLDSNERIGVGTSTPGTSIEIVSTSPEITLDDTSAGAGEAFFQLENNIAKLEGNIGTDIITYDVRAPASFRIDSTGTATFLNDFKLNSSRASKTAVEAVDLDQVLTRLAELPIHQWSYKTQGEVRHLGPMAEDFHTAFGLGDTPSAISVVDVAGVALAAAQELATRANRFEAENERLENELLDLERRLARLEGALPSSVDTAKQ